MDNRSRYHLENNTVARLVGTRDLGFIEDINWLYAAFTCAIKKLIVLGNADAINRNSPYGLL